MLVFQTASAHSVPAIFLSFTFSLPHTGGIAYVLDPANEFPDRCNMGMVGLEKVEAGSDEEQDVKGMIEEHVKRTGSARGQVRACVCGSLEWQRGKRGKNTRENVN